MFQPIQNKILVKVNHTFTKNATDIQRLAALENNTTIDPADYVTICGEIVALPKTISNTKEYEGYSLDGIFVGDTAIFSYQVIYNLQYYAEQDKIVYKNEIIYEGQRYFQVDISLLFGVIQGGQIKMLNGWVMLDEYPASLIVLDNQSKKMRGTVTSEINYIGSSRKHEKTIRAKRGDLAYFSPFYPQHYQINGKRFIILPQKHILGVAL